MAGLKAKEDSVMVDCRVCRSVFACLAVAFPTLIAFNVAPSATFFNQAAAFVGWGGFLLVLGAGLAQSARPRSPGAPSSCPIIARCGRCGTPLSGRRPAA